MSHITFTGYSVDAMDLAVKDAYKDYDAWADEYRYTFTIEGAPVTTATFALNEEYWFTLTITYKGAE